MMHKAWSSIGEVPYWFQGHPSNFKVTWDKKLPILTWIERFRTVTPVWIPPWLWNDAQSLMKYRRDALFFSRSSLKLQGHTAKKIINFDPNWAFPDWNSSLYLPMAMKWCTNIEAALERCPIDFQSHPSNFKVIWDKKLPISTWTERFRTVTLVWIHSWLWNDARSLM